MKGCITLDRKILLWEWYQDGNVFRMFIHLLLIANHKDGNWKGNNIKRGQVITGRLELAKRLHLSEMQIRTCINKLKSTNEISIKTTKSFSLITICKYDYYQNLWFRDNQENNQQKNFQITNKQPTDNQQITTNNNDNTVNNENNEEYALPPNQNSIVGKMRAIWMKCYPAYQIEENKDCPALLNIAYKIAKVKGWEKKEVVNGKLEQTTQIWEAVTKFIRNHSFYTQFDLMAIDNKWAALCQTMGAAKEKNKQSGIMPLKKERTQADMQKEVDDWNNSEF